MSYSPVEIRRRLGGTVSIFRVEVLFSKRHGVASHTIMYSNLIFYAVFGCGEGWRGATDAEGIIY
jgi:hypothetical protein